jgi:hypothetical protein
MPDQDRFLGTCPSVVMRTRMADEIADEIAGVEHGRRRC